MITDLGARALSIIEDESSAACLTANPITVDLAEGVDSSEASRTLVEGGGGSEAKYSHDALIGCRSRRRRTRGRVRGRRR